MPLMERRHQHAPDTRVSHFSDRLSGSRHSAGMNWSAAILAGGRARRLGGQDKSALIVDGVRFIDRQREALQPVDRSHRARRLSRRSPARRSLSNTIAGQARPAGRPRHGAAGGHDRARAGPGVRPAVCHHRSFWRFSPMSILDADGRAAGRATADGSRSVRDVCAGVPPVTFVTAPRPRRSRRGAGGQPAPSAR